MAGRILMRMGVSTWTLLPNADDVAAGVAKGCDPKVPLGVSRFDDLTAASFDLFNNCVDAADVNVGQDARLTRRNEVSDPGADQATSCIGKAEMLVITVADLPSKHARVELAGRANIGGGNLEIRQTTVLKKVSPPGFWGAHNQA
jgi:hypothetical protein